MLTPGMKQLEQERGMPIQQILTEAFEHHGSQTAVAAALGVSQPTISLWLKNLNLQVRTVIVEPGTGAPNN